LSPWGVYANHEGTAGLGKPIKREGDQSGKGEPAQNVSIGVSKKREVRRGRPVPGEKEWLRLENREIQRGIHILRTKDWNPFRRVRWIRRSKRAGERGGLAASGASGEVREERKVQEERGARAPAIESVLSLRQHVPFSVRGTQ